MTTNTVLHATALRTGTRDHMRPASSMATAAAAVIVAAACRYNSRIRSLRTCASTPGDERPGSAAIILSGLSANRASVPKRCAVLQHVFHAFFCFVIENQGLEILGF